MTNSYDPKIVAVSALGLACFAVGFCVTAVAYPVHAREAETAHVAPPATRASVPATKTTARGCRVAE